MKCQNCGKNEATFYYTSTVNGRTTEARVCQQCAEELGYTRVLQPMQRGFFRDPFALLSDDFFGGFASRLLTEFPAPGNTLAEAQETVPPREEGTLPTTCSDSATPCSCSCAKPWTRRTMKRRPGCVMSSAPCRSSE